MHRLTTTFVLGYHGCDESVAAKLVSGDPFFPAGTTMTGLATASISGKPIRAVAWSSPKR
jgi:hypothetical protein